MVEFIIGEFAVLAVLRHDIGCAVILPNVGIRQVAVRIQQVFCASTLN